MPGIRAVSKLDELGDSVRQVIKAYHGSPYDFDGFDASKIGTGEGAQAYGHGLYFAGNEDVAVGYRDKLKDLVDGPVPDELGSELQNIIKEVSGLAERRRTATGKEWYALDRALGDAHVRHQDVQHRISAASYNPGRMYEVEIGHPESGLLDLDVPMSQQSDAVKAGLANIDPRRFGAVPHEVGAGSYGGLRWKTPWDTLIGHPVRNKPPEALTFLDTALPTQHSRAAYADLAAMARSEAKASQAMREAGIPGIRYLDQGSRNAGDGTRNYVMFPGTEDSIRILRKYGMMAPIAAGAAAGGEEP